MSRLERGQSTVEYAAAIIPFFLLVMGIFDLGRAALYQHLLTNAAREAARHGIAAQRTEAAVCSAAAAAAAGMLPGVPSPVSCGGAGSGPVTAGGLTLTVTRDPVSVTNRYVSVQLSYDFVPITPLIGTLAGGSFTLVSSSKMYVEPE